MTVDPLGAQGLRAAVLSTWGRSPARLREDANTEEDHATGSYRDRVVVELAQNAADAAARDGARGRLVLRLVEDDAGATLVAANTGAPLDAAGLASLTSMRASAKDRTAVGRFGVGFAAVRSVSDDITVVSAGTGVRMSLDLTAAELTRLAADVPGLDAVLAARGTSLPVLRLPHALDAASTAAVLASLGDGQGTGDTEHAGAGGLADLSGYATAVVLRLRDAAAVEAVRSQLAAVDDVLLLALDALAEVCVEVPARRVTAAAQDDRAAPTGRSEPSAPLSPAPPPWDVRTVADVHERWTSVRRTGTVPEALLADRPVEERDRTTWSVTWAVPVVPSAAAAGVVHAPTPTDEPLTVPALLVATFPLDPSRRHVAEGPLADHVAARAGEAYADLAALVDDPLALVPTGLPAGRVDALVTAAALDALRAAPVLDGRHAHDCVLVEGDTSAALLDALRPAGLGVVAVPPARRAAARLLGAATMTLADVVDALPSALAPAQWRDLYAALDPGAGTDRTVREALDGILVPLADGTTARGARGLLVPAPGAAVPAVPGLRVVHPGAAHPALLRLGALAVDAPAVLALAAVEQAVHAAAEALADTAVDAAHGWPTDVAALCALLGGVVAAHAPDAQDVPAWWGDLPLPSDEDVWLPARDLAWPGSWAADHLDLPVVDLASAEPTSADPASADPASADPAAAPPPLLDERSAVACGVRTGLLAWAVEHETGDVADDGPDVPGWADYADYLLDVLGPGERLAELSVVADLDVVHDDSWGAAVAALAADPVLRAALVTPVRGEGMRSARGTAASVTTVSGSTAAASYAAWFVRDVLGAPFLVSDAPSPLHGLLPPRPDDLDDVTDLPVLAALGGVTSPDDLAALLAAPDAALWDGFSSVVADSTLHAAGAPVPLAAAQAVWSALEVAALAGLEVDPVPTVVVALRGGAARVVAVGDVAVAAEPMWSQVRAVVPVVDAEAADAVADALDCAVVRAADASVRTDEDGPCTVHEVPSSLLAAVPGLVTGWTEHGGLVVDGQDVDWWVTADQGVHVRAGASPAALAQGCAQASGRWAQRHLVELLLREPTRAAEVAAASAWDSPRVTSG